MILSLKNRMTAETSGLDHGRFVIGGFFFGIGFSKETAKIKTFVNFKLNSGETHAGGFLSLELRELCLSQLELSELHKSA